MGISFVLVLIAFVLALAEAFGLPRRGPFPAYGWLAIALYFASILAGGLRF